MFSPTVTLIVAVSEVSLDVKSPRNKMSHATLGTIKFIKICTPEKFAVITLKFEQNGFTIE